MNLGSRYNQHSFATVPNVNIARSQFDRSFAIKDTFDFDKLKPNTRNVFIAPESVEDFHNIMALNTPEALQKIKSGEQWNL